MSDNLLEISLDNLKLRTIIGFLEWERKQIQDVTISIQFKFDATAAIENDSIDDSVDYKVMTKKIIKAVESSNFQLLESLANMVFRIVRDTPNVRFARVRAEKPFAIRFSDTVSATISDYE